MSDFVTKSPIERDRILRRRYGLPEDQLPEDRITTGQAMVSDGLGLVVAGMHRMANSGVEEGGKAAATAIRAAFVTLQTLRSHLLQLLLNGDGPMSSKTPPLLDNEGNLNEVVTSKEKSLPN